MASELTGTTAQAMANAPLAGKDIGTAIKDATLKAAKRSNRREAGRMSKRVQGNEIAALFCKPEFQLPESVRVFDDKRDPENKKSSVIAKINLYIRNSEGQKSPFRISMSVYKNSTRLKGRGWRDEMRATMVKNCGVDPNDATAKMMLDALLDDLTQQYAEWRKTVKESAPMAASAPRRGAIVELRDADENGD